MKNKVYLFMFLGLVGCVTISPFQLTENKKIAVYIDIDDKITYEYRGFTVFTNQKKDINVELDRIPGIAKELEKYKIDMVDVLISSNKNIRNIKGAAEEVRNLGYDYLLYITDGSVCIDAYCNSIYFGSGVYGNISMKRFASNIAYNIVDTHTMETKYQRSVNAYIKYDSIERDENSNEQSTISKLLYCLDKENAKIAMWDMNRVAPLFNIDKQEEMGSNITGEVDAYICSSDKGANQEIVVPLLLDESRMLVAKNPINFNIDKIKIDKIDYDVTFKEDMVKIGFTFHIFVVPGCDRSLTLSPMLSGDGKIVPLDKRSKRKLHNANMNLNEPDSFGTEFTFNADEGEIVSIKKEFITDRKFFDEFEKAGKKEMLLKITDKPNC